jgi:hypothetical protein
MSTTYCFSTAKIVARTRLNVTFTSILPVLFTVVLSSQHKGFVVSPDTQTEHKYLKRRQENKREELNIMAQILETHHYINILKLSPSMYKFYN